MITSNKRNKVWLTKWTRHLRDEYNASFRPR